MDCRRVTREGSAETNRRVKGTVETQQETGRCAAAPRSRGSDQEGRMKRVQLRRRMLRSLEVQARNFSVRRRLRRSKNIGHNHHRRMERSMSNWQYAWRLRGNHALAAIVTLVRRIAGHGTAALHTLLILRHRGRAVRKLQAQQGDQRHNDEQSIAHCPISTLGRLDARVNERIRCADYPPGTQSTVLLPKMGYGTPLQGRPS